MNPRSAAIGQERMALVHFCFPVAYRQRERDAAIRTQPEVFHPPRPGTRALVGTVDWNVVDTSLLEIAKMGPADWIRTFSEHRGLPGTSALVLSLNVPLAGVQRIGIGYAFPAAGRIGRKA